MGINYSEMLLPGALKQNPGVSLLSMILTLWLLTYRQQGGPREENGMTEELWVNRGTQRLTCFIILTTGPAICVYAGCICD